MGIAGGDYDNDGRFDLVVTNMGNQLHSVYENQTATALDFTDFSGLFNIAGEEWTGWGSSWADFDLDTDLDLILVTGNIPISDLQTDGQVTQLFGNLTAQGNLGNFANWTDDTRLDGIGPLVGRGGAAADFDNDGDMDFAINQIGGPLVLLQTDGAEGNWLEIQTDRFAPGTVITLLLPNGQELRREIHAGSSYHSSEDPRVHFGLGVAEQITELRVRWLGGGEFVLKDVGVNQVLTVGYVPPSEPEGDTLYPVYLPIITSEPIE